MISLSANSKRFAPRFDTFYIYYIVFQSGQCILLYKYVEQGIFDAVDEQ